MRKLLKILTFAGLIMPILSACNRKNYEPIIKIGILQLVEHQALDESKRGFIEGLANEGYIPESNIIIDYQNAQGDQSNCTAIANKFVNKRMDLVLAIATPAAQAMANATKKIPILVSCITDPMSAGLVNSNEKPGENVTGVSDLVPVKKQIGLIKEILPNAMNVGIFYCANEANSKYQADIAVQEVESLGLKASVYTVSQLSEIKPTVEYMVTKVDAVYTPTDNMVASAMENIAEISNSAGIPVICGDVTIVYNGAAGTYGTSYYELGKLTASQAVKILRNRVSPGEIPVDYVKNPILVLNSSVLNKLNLKVPDELMNEAKII